MKRGFLYQLTHGRGVESNLIYIFGVKKFKSNVICTKHDWEAEFGLILPLYEKQKAFVSNCKMDALFYGGNMEAFYVNNFSCLFFIWQIQHNYHTITTTL